MKRPTETTKKPRQRGEIYDIYDLQLTLLDLKTLGFDVYVSVTDPHRLRLTCNKTNNRFLVECLGHNEWPVPAPEKLGA
jgi:hypothetical protein